MDRNKGDRTETFVSNKKVYVQKWTETEVFEGCMIMFLILPIFTHFRNICMNRDTNTPWIEYEEKVAASIRARLKARLKSSRSKRHNPLNRSYELCPQRTPGKKFDLCFFKN